VLLKGQTRLLVGVAVFLVALAVAVLRVTTLSQSFGVRLSMPLPLNDFNAAVYCPASAFVHGANPYDRRQLLQFCPARVYCRGSVPGKAGRFSRYDVESCASADVFPPYLPATLILHAPFALLSMNSAGVVYFLLNVGLAAGLVVFALRMTGGRMSSADVFLGAGLLLLSRPGQWNLLLGQVALELTLATYIALYCARDSPRVSGVALAVAAYKPTFGVPLALLMLARGDRRAVAWGAVFTLILNLPPTLVLFHRAGGPETFFDQLIRSQAAYQAINDPSSRVFDVDLLGLLSRLMGGWIGSGPYLLISLLVLVATARAIRTTGAPWRGQGANLSASLVCLGMLLSMHHNAYDLVLLTAPVIFLARSSLPPHLLRPQWRLGLLTLYALLGANYVTTLSVLHHLEHHRPAWLVLASLNGALLLGIFLIYLALGESMPKSVRLDVADPDRP
jgi:hypothetical protein